MGETRVDLEHLLEDLRDAYPSSLEETILTEIIANSLDSGADRITLTADPGQSTLTVTDNGSGMQRTAMRRYHDIASSTKVRGQGIGFAGVGIKLGLLVCEEVVTETRRGKTHVATRWHLAHIIHDRFYCNRRYAAVTGLAAGFTQPSGQARHSVGRHTVSSMPSFLAAPRARLAWRLGGFVTNRHE